jgi:hypothetical protein
MKFKGFRKFTHLFLAVNLIAFGLSGCATVGHYKNPNTETIITMKLNDRLKGLLKKGTHYFAQEWNIYSSENCMREEGYGKAAYFSDWYVKKTEERTSLQTDKRVYIEVTTVVEPKVEPIRIHCSGVVSFIPEKNTKYLAEQYGGTDLPDSESLCKIEIKEAFTNKAPETFLIHSDCGDHLFL